MHYTCLIIIHDSWYGTGPGIEPGTFGLADECSTTELTLLLINESWLLDDRRYTKYSDLGHGSFQKSTR